MESYLQWEDENGDIIEAYKGEQGRFFSLLPLHAEGSTVCLKFIDPYGDTTFNQIQIPYLLAELEELRSGNISVEAREQLESIITFIRKSEGKVHTYIKFYGD